MTRRLAVLFGCALLLGACAQPSAGDVVATRVALAPLVDATLTALVPTLTPLPPLPPPPTATAESYAPPPPPAARPPTPEGTPYGGTRDAGYPVPPRPSAPPAPPTRRPTRTPLPSPTPTATYTPLPTRTHGAYLGPLAEVLFLRAGNLWLAEIGGAGERQLTFEVGDWTVDEFAVSDGRVVYLAKRWESAFGSRHDLVRTPREAVGHLLDLGSGERRVLLDDLPPGNAHLLAVWPGEVDVLIASGEALRVDLATGDREPLERAEELRVSPGARFEARLVVRWNGSTVVPADRIKVTDRETGAGWWLAIDWFPPEGPGEHWFRGWSPDGAYLLVAGRRKGPGAIYEALYLVDLTTHAVRLLNPDGALSLGAAGWAPDKSVIYTSACTDGGPYGLEVRCAVGTVDIESGAFADLAHPLPFRAEEIVWLDGDWLLFAERQDAPCYGGRCRPLRVTVWAARRDGSQLSPLVWGAESPHALP